MMVRLDSRVVMGATLFATPGMKSGSQISGLVFALIAVGVAVTGLMLLRHRGPRPGPSDPNPDDGWGKGPRGPEPHGPEHPRGGIPLDHAAPARVRLRGAGRLADLVPRPARRPVREPDRAPSRIPGIG
jgi:hypothetical protein